MSVKLTPREQQVLAALTNDPLTAAKFCISLVKKGLAVKHGSRMFPKWSLRSLTVGLPKAQKTL